MKKLKSCRRVFGSILLLIVAFCCSGCSYAFLERQVYPICLSVDIDENDRFQVAVLAPQSTGEKDEAQYVTLSASGRTYDEAMNILAAATPYPLNYCQIRLCLLGYDLAATTNLRPLCRSLFELPTMRPDAYVMVALGNAAQTMSAQKPDLGMRLSTHLNLLFERLLQENMLPHSSLSACVREMESGLSDPLLCICAVNPKATESDNKQQNAPKNTEGSPQQAGDASAAFATSGEPWNEDLLPPDLIAGMLPHTGKNPVEYLGSAAISDGRVSGLLSARETQLIVRALVSGKRKVAIDGEKMQLQLLIPTGGDLGGRQDELLAALRALQSLDCDVMGFGWAAAKAFYTDAAFEAFGFDRRFREAELIVSEK